MNLAAVTLDDKYTLESGRVYLTGIQALVRLPMMQKQQDRLSGLNTACFISGYRGSPLGGLDQALWGARDFLKKGDIHFQPGVNEDLAATAVWGTQQVNMFRGARYDGVFSMWYGKGPGVDRCGDVFKHGNAAGTSPHGGVLLLAGDDHTCKSSTLAHQSEFAFVDALIPVLNPAGVQEIIDYGLMGIAISRYSGCWVAMKTIAETVDSSASIDIDPSRFQPVIPTDFEMPADGLHIRWPDIPLDQEFRLHRHKLYAALAFARDNHIDRIVIDSPSPRLGIVTTGKSYLDVMQALEDLGIDEALAAEIGLRIYKVGMPWPLEREGARQFAEGLEEVLVVEEKRALIENQFKEQLYNWREDVRPRVIGKFDENREWALPSNNELTPARIARVIATRIDKFFTSERIQERLKFLEDKERALSNTALDVVRKPHFCSGCPHNTSTRVPEGSRALAGIGCHYMAIWMDRDTETFTQMGGEGVPWVGQAPFTETKHVFANLGDGTYVHSGLLAIRAAVSAGVNITYKILYNDAVAMTGGQPLDGSLSVQQITHQLYGEGIRHITVLSDEPEKYRGGSELAEGVKVGHRDLLDSVQREYRELKGVSVIVFDQTCAAEKRRRRKRGKMPDPAKRVVINERVCEGCGDCGEVSNCLSVIPLETPFGRKRSIDQSACNKDFSCVNGFCPSFVTVHGGTLRKPEGNPGVSGSADASDLPPVTLPALDEPYGILVTGIGGTGVVTIGALLGMAAHLEGKGVSVLDMTGLAQKYGAVVSHVRIAEKPEDIHAVRIAAGGARLLLGCDALVASGFEALSKVEKGHSSAVINSHALMTAQFIKNPDLHYPGKRIRRLITDAIGENNTSFVDSTHMAEKLVGNSIGSNLMMVGYAWQKGMIPLGEDSILRAIELNGVAVDFNKQAFDWGRQLAAFPDAHQVLAGEPVDAGESSEGLSFDEKMKIWRDHLTGYQSARYASRLDKMVDKVRSAEQARSPGMNGLTETVAEAWVKLLAFKDEYEMARLFADDVFDNKVAEMFEGDYTIKYHLAPPLLARKDPVTGHPRKSSYGPWIKKAFGVLSAMKFLRGTPLDVFGYSEERKLERQMIGEYAGVVDELIEGLDHDNHALALEIAAIPLKVRGFGHIKQNNHSAQQARLKELMELWREGDRVAEAA